jgi:hypothetical protein
MKGRFVLDGSHLVGFRFRLETEQGQIALRSERYEAKPDALRGIEAVRGFAARADCFQRTRGRDGSFSFVLRSLRGSLVATGATHRSEAARDAAIAFVALHASDAALIDRAVERTPARVTL